jgi:hypothetical protein
MAACLLLPQPCRSSHLRPADGQTGYGGCRRDGRRVADPIGRVAFRPRDDHPEAGPPLVGRAMDGHPVARRLALCRSMACVPGPGPNDPAACCSTADRPTADPPRASAVRVGRSAWSATADRWMARRRPVCPATVCARAVDRIDRTACPTTGASPHRPACCSTADRRGACPATVDRRAADLPPCPAIRRAASTPHSRACRDRAASRDPFPTTPAQVDSFS